MLFSDTQRDTERLNREKADDILNWSQCLRAFLIILLLDTANI